MSCEPPFHKTPEIDSLAMEMAEMVGFLMPMGGLATSPTMHRELRIKATSTKPVLVIGLKLLTIEEKKS